jgi:hypothetical protein
MRTVPIIGLLLVVPALAAAEDLALPDYGPPVLEPAPEDSVREAPTRRRSHANPRLKLSYRRFAVAGLDTGRVPLDGGQLDVYLLSRRWVRLGLEIEGGSGHSSSPALTADLWYGLFGLTVGLQYPARVTPFIEGRAAAGVLGGTLSGQTTIAGTTVSAQGLDTATLCYLGGVEAGVELYALGRTYLTVALGWVHPVYLGLSPLVIQATGAVRTTKVATDTFTFKVGLGF